MDTVVVEGDLLEQDVDVIVNAWNRNFIPWWLLLPQGVSRAIKRRGGCGPFRELASRGIIPLGGAVLTSPGHLGFKAIIHVAGINLLWRSSERSIRDSVRNAMNLAASRGFKSVAFPLIGAGTGGIKPAIVLEWMLDELRKLDLPLKVHIVRFKPTGYAKIAAPVARRT
ncbi:MAG: Appr-1-p processing protein [Phycisphaerales bacterium]|nr:Appr-1-p processing protein [Phycisphaerales bacterium]